MLNEKGMNYLSSMQLKQKYLKNSDMIVLSHGSFERILIFDRDEFQSKNQSKKDFLKLGEIILSILL